MSTRDAVFGFIKGYQAQYGFPPTIREIADGLGISSTSTIHAHLVRLRDSGRIRFDESKARTVRVVSEA